MLQRTPDNRIVKIIIDGLNDKGRDLVRNELKQLKIRYETCLHDNKVWLPQEMEVYYVVRVLFLTHIRERQFMKADGFREISSEPPKESSTASSIN